MKPLRLAAFLLSGLLCSLASAQSDEEKAVKTASENFANYALDLAVPESPAFAIMGVSPQSVIHPTSTRQLAASLVNGISSGGQIQQGIALDTAPYLLVAGNDLTLDAYRTSTLTRLLARTRVSLATAKADNDETGKGTKAGAGVHVTVYDRGDPRLVHKDGFDLSGCYDAETKKAFDLPQPSPTDPERDKKVEQKRKMIEESFPVCRKRARDAFWNRTNWQVGLAGAWTNESTVSDGLRSSGAAVWTTLAYGFEEILALRPYAQLLLHVRAHDDEIVARKDAENGVVKRDSSVLGMRLRLGSDSGAFLAEASYTRGQLDNGDKERVRRVAIGGEFKVTKDVWIVASIGGEGGFSDGTRRNFIMGGLKFGSASEPQFSLGK